MKRVCFKCVEEWNVPKVFSKALAVFQTFGTVVSTEMKHTHTKINSQSKPLRHEDTEIKNSVTRRLRGSDLQRFAASNFHPSG
jgi:hypothetical protein